jgi:hypothetical protein
VADDQDLPDDQKDCTKDSCDGAAKVNDPLPKGSECSGGKCDASGVCSECSDPSDCPEPSPCVHATCSQNKCGTENAPNGEIAPASEQTPKDCQTVVCDGNGGEKSVASNDLPDDGNECTIDTCQGTAPTFTPIAAGKACPNTKGKTCDGKGACGGK